MEPTVNALLRLMAIQQTQILALMRILCGGDAMPLRVDGLLKACTDTHDKVGTDVENDLRDAYRVLLVTQDIAAAGLLDLWGTSKEKTC